MSKGKICYNCRFKGNEWKLDNEIPSHICQNPKVQAEVDEKDDPWLSLRHIFNTCDLFRRKSRN